MLVKNKFVLLLIAISCGTLHATDSASEQATVQTADAESKTAKALTAAVTETQKAEKLYIVASSDGMEKPQIRIGFYATAAGEPVLPVAITWNRPEDGLRVRALKVDPELGSIDPVYGNRAFDLHMDLGVGSAKRVSHPLSKISLCASDKRQAKQHAALTELYVGAELTYRDWLHGAKMKPDELKKLLKQLIEK